jgi:hypothetical protein
MLGLGAQLYPLDVVLARRVDGQVGGHRTSPFERCQM